MRTVAGGRPEPLAGAVITVGLSTEFPGDFGPRWMPASGGQGARAAPAAPVLACERLLRGAVALESGSFLGGPQLHQDPLQDVLAPSSCPGCGCQNPPHNFFEGFFFSFFGFF